jgi:hypothetical protein
LLNNRQQSGRRRGRGGQRQQGNSGRPEQGNRIDNRARGNAPQLLEKYKSLARDAQQAGDRVMTEYYLQFADHYFRVVAEQRARYEEQRRQRDDWRDDEDEGGEGEDRAYASDNDDDGEGDEEPRRQAQNRNNNRDRSYRPRDDDRGARMRDDERAPRAREDDRSQRPRDEERPQRSRDDDRGNRRPREDRYRRDEQDAPSTIDVAVLPPAFGSDGPMTAIPDLPMGDEGPSATQDEAPPAPRRRGRPKREAVSDEAA